MNNIKELIAALAAYVMEYSFEAYPYMTAANGDVVYTDAAQEMFNQHHDEIERIIQDVRLETVPFAVAAYLQEMAGRGDDTAKGLIELM